MDPYTQSVIDATQGDFNTQNARANSIVTGNAGAQGALGGDRVGVAQALTQEGQNRVQAPVMAGLRSAGFQSAVANANAQKQRQLQAGVAGTNTAIAGGNAIIGAGTVAQQNQQQRDTQARADYFQQQGYPFQVAQWLAGITTGVGSQLGGTSTGYSQTQGPQPNTWAQLAGLGIAGAGLFLNRGGRVHRATGGYNGPWGGVDSWVPSASIVPGSGAPHASAGAGKAGSPDTSGNDLVKQAMGFAEKWRNSPDEMGSPGVGSPITTFGAAGDYGVPTFMADGGGVAPLRSGYGMASFPAFDRVGFADGGGPMSFDDRFVGDDRTDLPDVSAIDPEALRSLPYRRAGIAPATPAPPVPPPDVIPDPGLQQVSPQAMDQWRSGVGNPAASKTPEADDDEEAPKALGYAGPPPSANAPFNRDNPQAGFAPPEKNFLGFNKITPDLRQAIIAAGLGMMATRRGGAGSFLGAAGEGGLAGVGAYSQAQKLQAERDAQQQKLLMDQRRLDQQASDSAARLKLTASSQAETARHNKASEKQESYTPVGSATVDDGAVHPLVMEKNSGKVVDAVTGKPPNSTDKLNVKGSQSSAVSPADIKVLAQYTVATGDESRLKSLGRNDATRGAIQAAINAEKEAKGISDAEYAKRKQEYAATGIGQNAAARTRGVREENLNLILRATDAAIPAALEASEKVARTGLVPLNRIIQHGEIMVSDPDLVQFGMANLQLAEHWARAMNPLGVMRESDRDLALKYLDTALSKNTYQAAVLQLKKQITRERDAVHGGSTTIPSSGNVVPGAVGGGGGFTPPADAIARQYNGKTYYYDPATKQPYPGQ